MPTNTATDIQQKIQAVPFWWHSVPFTPEISAPGFKTLPQLQNELAAMSLPDLRGKTVLDIGAWDGFFSFEAEKRGASRVVALDHYVWCLDTAAMTKYWRECQAQKKVPEQYDQVPGLWHPKELPGKRGFDTAKELLGSKVESVVADFSTTDLAKVGQFDVVFFMGVLYHMHNPFESLKRLAQLTKELAVIETEAISVPGYEDASFCEFYETSELNGDVNNWWAPTENALIGMCRAAGFKRLEPKVSPVQPPEPGFLRKMIQGGRPDEKRQPLHYRAVLHAWK